VHNVQTGPTLTTPIPTEWYYRYAKYACSEKFCQFILFSEYLMLKTKHGHNIIEIENR